MTKSVALITAGEARDLDEDLAPLQGALTAAGAKVAVIDWDGDAVDWKRFDLALLRSTWGYDREPSRFLDWARAVSNETLLLNPLPLIEGKFSHAVLSFDTPLYARVDLIRDSKGLPCVLELELIEPSLFFMHATGAAERFSSCILQRIAQ